MSQRLSKLVQYLEDGNYQMAVTTFNQQPESLPEHQVLELARAFIANQHYQKCIQICSQYQNSQNPATYFDANILIIKATYLMGNKTSTLIRNVLNNIQKNSQFQRHHIQTVKQIAQVLQYQTNFKALAMNRNDLFSFSKQYYRQLQRQQNQNPLTEGMPMFIVSSKWYEQFQKFVGRKQDGVNNPGPLTHFQILDHRFIMLNDPLPQKKYTNYAIFPSARVRILPKNTWLMLKDIFRGNQLKRYNVWVSGKPRQILTQIYLKKIKVRKSQQRQIYQIQITKKQTWGGLIKKLKTIWNQSLNRTIFQEKGGDLSPVSEGLFLQQIDTSGKIYLFGILRPNRETVSSSSIKQGLNSCNYCRKTADLKFCQCKSVKYCDARCQKQDRQKHRKKCQLQCSHLKQKAAVLESFNLPQKAYGGRKGLVGLRNLGNTCYMNSGLQCLSNTKQITDYFMSNQFIKQINHSNPLGTKGNLACAYAQLMRQMWTGGQSSISPFNLKKIIGKFAGQFSGYGQQDSQQFISYLIDGLQQDLNLVKVKQTFQTSDQIIPDQQASLKSQLNYSKRIQSYIRQLMVGQFKSTVICQRCDRKSVCFDPYMLLSLPIPALKQKQVFFVSMDCSGKTKKINFTMDSQTKLGHLRQQLSRFYDINQKNSYLKFIIVDIKNMKKIEDNFQDNVALVDIYNKIVNDNIVYIAYQFVQPNTNEKRFQIEYEYNDKKCCFPRFVNLPINGSQQQIMRILDKSVTRYTRQQGTMKKFVQKIDVQPNKMVIKLNRNIDMLMCTSQQKIFKLHTLQKRTNLYDCLTNFTNIQILQDNNKWYCNKCKQFVRASKQMQIYKSNKILVLTFKRFSRGFKVKDFIDFPIQGLDMGPFIKCNKQKNSIMYDLYGVVNHYGTLSGGHYTAYCKNFINNDWYQFDDSRVSRINYNDIASESAYVLFYRRRN